MIINKFSFISLKKNFFFLLKKILWNTVVIAEKEEMWKEEIFET